MTGRRRVAIGAPTDAAADAGAAVVRSGGNAVDAALAAAAVTMVNEIGIVSPSAGAFITVQTADGAPPMSIDGWVDMPGRSHRHRFGTGTTDVDTEYGGGLQITVGPGSVATHGAVAAFGEAHRRWGAAAWEALFEPAIDVATDGFSLGSASRFYLGYVRDVIYGVDDASRRLLSGPDDTPIRIPELADSLRRIGTRGPDEMYTGDLGIAVADDIVARGGLLGVDDLAAYRPVVRPSLTVSSGDWTLGTNPPPSVGGVGVAAMLALLGDRPRDGRWDVADVDRLVDVQRSVLGYRRDMLEPAGDLHRAATDYLALLAGGGGLFPGSGSTVQVSTVDTDGTACSLTMSSGYGSGLIARDTGIWLNNCLGEQELNPHGLHGLVPGRRLLSNMAPTVGRKAGDGRVGGPRRDIGAMLAIGSPGADRIATALAQVIAGFVNGGMTVQAAIDHPRLHVHHAGRADEQVMREAYPTMYYGGVIAALLHPDATVEAATDPRRDGATRIDVVGG
ncbi:gamma-glutamyltransferase [Williamsia sterculiae]|uniref:Gamma-glutamyltranspeptidase / glutathione hydrolase n=1 Tax=Williamsia sterculiae TaxID=1344003 RepID=A0A1N7FKZ3_9NOCA|nr:gamma-glutamyltransferase [Williamsia sterculiae]SIS01019.1 gamma-glutamyltranspeptidase / glutathione hydrolase [Williamsia sterculiae]